MEGQKDSRYEWESPRIHSLYSVMESLESREIVGDQSVLVGSHCSTLPDAGRLAEELIDMKIKEATA